jgi:hypothetical protein
MSAVNMKRARAESANELAAMVVLKRVSQRHWGTHTCVNDLCYDPSQSVSAFGCCALVVANTVVADTSMDFGPLVQSWVRSRRMHIRESAFLAAGVSLTIIQSMDYNL